MDNPHLFIKLHKYKEFVRKLEFVSDRVEKVETLLDKIEQLKIEEDGQLQKWRESVEEIKSNLQGVREVLRE